MGIIPDRLQKAIKVVFGTQRAIAQEFGVHESVVSRWIRGEVHLPEEVLRSLYEMGVSPEFLQGISDDILGAATDSNRLALMQRAVEKAVASNPELGVSNVVEVAHRKRPTRLSPEIDRISVDQPTNQDVIIPMLESSIPAGDRVPIYEDLATQFNVTVYYRNCLTMRVKGDSMIDAGICDGDRVVIKRGHRFRDGDVIAAVVDGEMTLKGVWKRDGKIFLVPANRKYRVVEIAEESDFQCLGVCIDTFRPPTRVDWRE